MQIALRPVSHTYQSSPAQPVVLCYVVVVVVLTLTRIIKSVVTGQAPVTLELRNTPRKNTQPKVVHAYITADAIHASTRYI